MGKITDTVKHLIILNVLFYLATKLAFPQLQDLLALHFPKNPQFGIWQYITSMFMHDQVSLMHILFNMIGIWMFGSPLEELWGRNKFLFFYFSAGIGAGIVYTLVNYLQFNHAFNALLDLGASSSEIYSILDRTKIYQDVNLQNVNQIYNTSAIGASGALYGLLVAYGMKFPNAKLMMIFFPVPVAAKYFIPLLILGDLFFGVFSFAGDNTAHFAHIGGALFGFIIMLFWKENQFKRWN